MGKKKNKGGVTLTHHDRTMVTRMERSAWTHRQRRQLSQMIRCHHHRHRQRRGGRGSVLHAAAASCDARRRQHLRQYRSVGDAARGHAVTGREGRVTSRRCRTARCALCHTILRVGALLRNARRTSSEPQEALSRCRRRRGPRCAHDAAGLRGRRCGFEEGADVKEAS